MQKGTCRHFNGSFHNKECGAGVNYRQLVGGSDFGWGIRLPCHTDNAKNEGCARCDKYEEPTAEEIAATEAEIKKRTDQFLLTLPLIADMKKRHKGKSAKETVACPVCGGKLHMRIASVNGHVWGKCETADCLAWME